MVPRNDQGLLDLGINHALAFAIIKELTPDNYCKGPEPDDMYPWKDVWVFGCEYEGEEIYIKFNVERLDRQQPHVTVLSFHKAQYAMRYPLKGQ